MSFDDGLIVDLLDLERDGAPFRKIDTPKTVTKCSSRSLYWKVVALSGRRFAIDLTIEQHFNWFGANALEITIGFDTGNVVNQKAIFVLKADEESDTLARDTGLDVVSNRGEEFGCRIDHILVPANGHDYTNCQKAYFKFVKLLDEPIKPNKSFSSTISGESGRIYVTVKRTVILKGRPQHVEDVVNSTPRLPNYRLIRDGITLEVVLDIDTNTSVQQSTSFKQKGCAATIMGCFYKAVFMYHESEHIKEILEPDQIEEVRGRKRKSSAPKHDRSATPSPTDWLSLINTVLDDPPSEEHPPQQESRLAVQADNAPDHNHPLPIVKSFIAAMKEAASVAMVETIELRNKLEEIQDQRQAQLDKIAGLKSEIEVREKRHKTLGQKEDLIKKQLDGKHEIRSKCLESMSHQDALWMDQSRVNGKENKTDEREDETNE